MNFVNSLLLSFEVSESATTGMKENRNFRIISRQRLNALELFVCKKQAGQKTCSDIFCTLNRFIFEDDEKI